jgi:cyclohexadienyl dehydratase
VLRVCTPGDYKPFAFQKPDGTFEGIDVDHMQSLMASLVSSGMGEDERSNDGRLHRRQVRIAVGGISVTLDRQKRVAFSTAYMVNGKTPLVRCAEVAKYQTVADIDKPGVKVIANPGGSNERFAKANFKNATVTIHTDNITIFDEVLKGNADVFDESAETISSSAEAGPVRGQPGQTAAVRRDGVHAAAGRRGKGLHRPVAASD